MNLLPRVDERYENSRQLTSRTQYHWSLDALTDEIHALMSIIERSEKSEHRLHLSLRDEFLIGIRGFFVEPHAHQHVVILTTKNTMSHRTEVWRKFFDY